MECGRGPGIYALVGYARVFVYLCGTPENLDESEKERERWRRANGQPRCAALLVRGSE